MNNEREFVVLLTIKPESKTVEALDIKLQLKDILGDHYNNFQVNDVKEFEKEKTRRGTKFNFVDSA